MTEQLPAPFQNELRPPPLRKVLAISKLRTVDTDFVDLYPTSHTLPVGLTYRYSDSMLVDLKYVALGGAFAFPTGFFRDRSQLAVRLTYLLN